MTDDSKNDTSDTEPAPAPDAETLSAVAEDLATLESVARGLGDGLHEIVVRLQKQAATGGAR
jgi:hypothetical protein